MYIAVILISTETLLKTTWSVKFRAEYVKALK